MRVIAGPVPAGPCFPASAPLGRLSRGRLAQPVATAAHSGRSGQQHLGRSGAGDDLAGAPGASPTARSPGPNTPTAAAAAAAAGVLSTPLAPPGGPAAGVGGLLDSFARVHVPQLPSVGPLLRQQPQQPQGHRPNTQQRQQQQQQAAAATGVLEDDHPGPWEGDAAAAPAGAATVAAPAAAAAAAAAPVPARASECGDVAALAALVAAWGAAGQAPADEAAWAGFERESRPMLRGAQPAEIAALLSALAHAGRRPSAAWLAAAQDEILSAAQRSPAAAVPLETWAAALSALARCGAVDRRFTQAALAAAAPAAALAAAPAAALSQLLWGVAKARLSPGGAWLGALASALSARAPELSPPQLACCLRSLGVLAERADPRGLRGAAGALAAELAARHDGAAPGELAQALWALARLGHRASPQEPACPVAALLGTIVEQLPRLTAGQLSCLLWAAARLEAAVPPPTAGLLLAEVASQMPAFSNREFTQSAWALAKLCPAPARAPAPFVERFWQQAHLRSGRLAAGESTLLLWAVARLGLEAPPRWLAAELAQSQRALHAYRPDQLVNTILALARMGRAPPPAWVAAFEGAARTEEFGMQDIVNVLWAFKALGHTPSPEWQHACVRALRAACAEACGQGEPYGPGQVGALLEEAGLLPVLAAAVAQQAAEEAAGGGGGGGAAGGAPAGAGRCAEECPISFELPLGAV